MKREHLDPESRLYRVRHSLAHVMAQAVLELRPNAKLGYGPPTEHGFFYDFDLDPPLSTEDFPQIEERMRRIIKENNSFEREDYLADELLNQLRAEGKDYKADMAEGFKAQGDETLSVYRAGNFSDMCEGPHVAATGDLPANAFMLDSIAGAYWKGDESNKMMQRIYGLAFLDRKELKAFLERRELAKQRDHRKLGAEMQLFAISEEVGKGLPLFMPHGEAIRGELEKLAMETEFRAGYERVSTPHITREGLYHTSGHLPYYKEDMFPPMNLDGEAYYLKPMNCPHHHMIYKAVPRSYRELPLRLAEYGMCYRYEQSGELSGLLRVRALAINDAHIYCTPEQTKAEFVQVMQMHMDYYRLFGISDYWVRLSLPDLDEAGKYLDQPERWQQAMEIITTSMQEVEFPYEAVPGEAAFYGPKVDMQIQNVVGREETASTNQLDVMMAERFDLTYVGPDNRPHHPNIIHRAPLGSHERFIAFLVEHYGGIFPTWLAPEQVRIVPVAPAFLDYAHTLEQALRQQLVRVRVDDSQESFGKKIRNGVTDKVPNLFIIGQKEQDDEAVSWRRHGSKDQQTLRFDAAKNSLLEEIRERRDWRRNSA